MWILMTALVSMAHHCAADYCPPSSPQSDGMRDIMLCYVRSGGWDAEQFKPYVTYLDRTGKPRDWFYDAYLFLMGGGAPSGASYMHQPTNKADWEYYLDTTFAPSTHVDALEKALVEADNTLGQKPRTVPVIFMLPYPCSRQRNFGDVDGDGVSEDFAKDTDRAKAIAWITDAIIARFKADAYPHLRLWGFYWMNEEVQLHDEDVVRASAAVVHKRGYKFHWIPWYNAPGVPKWKELGFDLVIMQPNFAFIASAGGTHWPDFDRLTSAANMCCGLGMGIEMEMDGPSATSPASRLNLRGYLNWGTDELSGYMRGAVRAYFQGRSSIAALCKSDKSLVRQFYDDLYAFHKGTYKRRRLSIAEGCEYKVEGKAVAGFGDDGRKLTDGIIMTRAAQEDRLVAFAGDSTVVVDLGGPRLVSDVRVHVAQCREKRIEAPDSLELSLADSPAGPWELVGSAAPACGVEDAGWAVGSGVISFRPTVARFVKVALRPGAHQIALHEIMVMPASHLLWDCACELKVDGRDLDASALTDGFLATGQEDAARWDAPSAAVDCDLGLTRYAAQLRAHFVDDASPGLIVLASSGDAKVEFAEIAAKPPGPAGWVDVLLGCVPIRRLRVEIEGACACDELQLVPARSLAFQKSYVFSPTFEPNYPDTDNKELTDGVLTEQGFADGKTVGWRQWARPRPAVTIDLGKKQRIDRVRVQVEGGGNAGVGFPKKTTVSVSLDGTAWEAVGFTTSPPASTLCPPEGSQYCLLGWIELPVGPVDARFVRVSFVSTGWLMVSEIQVLSSEANVAFGRTYTFTTPPSCERKYADTRGLLTDGVTPRRGWRQVVGCDKGKRAIIVDLEQPQRIGPVRAYLVGGGHGAVYFPRNMKVSLSMDGKQWTEAGSTTDVPPEPDKPGRAYGFMTADCGGANGQFVRLDFERRGWLMIGEIEVFPPARKIR